MWTLEVSPLQGPSHLTPLPGVCVSLSSHMDEPTQAVQVSQKSAVVRAELYSAVAWCCGAE